LNLRGQVFDTTTDTLVKLDNIYFKTLLSSDTWELDVNGEYFVDRCGNGFDRILEYMSTGVLSTEGLNSYDKDCVYDNLKYFKIPHKERWDYSKMTLIENLSLGVCLQLQDGRLCGSTSDYSICIYNMDTNIIETTLKGHTRCISRIIQLEDGRLCSCSYDKKIKLWNIDSGKCELTIRGHTSRVDCVIQLMDGRICSGSGDNIKVWSKDSGECEATIDAQTNVYCIVQLKDGRICSGHNRSIKVRKFTTRLCEMTAVASAYNYLRRL
jgi:WD40 repeat protein